jgi:hypothetical protein
MFLTVSTTARPELYGIDVFYVATLLATVACGSYRTRPNGKTR